MGNIGNGKSTITNLLAGYDVALALKSTKTTTLGLNPHLIEKENLRILDSQGFGCPNYSDNDLYNKMCLNLIDPTKEPPTKIKEEGISTILIPIMMNKGGRISEETIKVIYNHIMMF